MCRAYIEAHVPLNEALAAARKWADGEALTLIAPSTRAVEAQPWLDSAGVAIGTTSIRHSRFSARPHGTVIGWCLNLKEVLEVESRSSVIGIVAVQAQASHAPWITAHDVERLAGSDIARVAEASKAIKAMVEGIGTVALLDLARARDWCHELVLGLRVRWFPVPSRGDLGGGAVVPEVRIVLPMSRSCSPSVASRSITSRSIGGSSGSHRSSSRRPGLDVMCLVIAGSSTRPTSRSTEAGRTYTGRSTSTGRSSTCGCPPGAT